MKKKNLQITFSDAMNQIDKNRDFNEYNEMNSSAYFKETMNNADEEINKMMSSPLISYYRKIKRPTKVYTNLIKNVNKEYFLKRFLLLDKGSKDKSKKDINNKPRKKIKINPIFERLSQIKMNFNYKHKKEMKEEKSQKEKLLLTSGNTPFFPKINKNFNIEKKYIFSKKRNFEDFFSKTKLDSTRNFSRTHDKNLMNYELNHKSSKKFVLKNIYEKCLKGIENFESKEQRDLKISPKIKIEKPKTLEKNHLYNNDIEMNKYLVENINVFYEIKEKKKVNIAKQIEDLRLKRDPILHLSEKFAYLNRKPLLKLFNINNTEEEEVKSKDRKGPLAKLKVKDRIIMENLEKDNRNKNLLIKRLEEDQIKYRTKGYFFITEENEEDESKIQSKKNNNETNKTISSENNYDDKSNIDENNNNIRKSSLYESQKNILLKD